MKKLLLFTAAIGLMIATSNAQELKTTFTSGPFDQVTTSINTVEAAKIIAYPNPTASVINVESELLITEVVIFDMTGKVINTIIDVNDYKTVIDLSDYNRGVYFIKVNGNINKVIKR